MQVFDLSSEPPPPPEPPQDQEVRLERQRPRDPEGAASPENIRSQATPIVAPEPIIQLPVQPPVAVTPTPNQGAAPTQGASDRPGPGTGAGGIGTGTGAGGSGSGGGGGGGIGTRPALLRGITSRDYPVQVQRRWPPGGSIFLRLRIEPDGRPSQCDVMRSFGDPLTDHWTCRLVMERGVFRPGTNERGTPVAAWFGYVQRDTGRFER